MRIEPDDLHAILGAPKFDNEVAVRTCIPGVATGLAWTPVGGDILFVEATRVAGTGKLILTGQLGEVMKESAQAALSLVKSRAQRWASTWPCSTKSDIHVHVPAGAIPKDGPSAGVAMFTALVSLLTDQNVRGDTAMTGEISLRGLVLPVGGIKEKVLAAHRAGLRACCCRRATGRTSRTSRRARARRWSSSGWRPSTTPSRRRSATRAALIRTRAPDRAGARVSLQLDHGLRDEEVAGAATRRGRTGRSRSRRRSGAELARGQYYPKVTVLMPSAWLCVPSPGSAVAADLAPALCAIARCSVERAQ